MPSEPISLPSGASLEIQIAPFATSHKLWQTIARELTRVEFTFDMSAIEDASARDFNSLKNAVFQVLQSDAVDAAMRDCAKRCLYNHQRITDSTFDSVEARADYLPVAWEVTLANIRPFANSLLSLLSKGEKPKSADPKPA